MTQMDLFQTATSSQQDTPVSRLVSQVSAADRRMIATSGRTSCRLLHPKDPLGAFSKMFMATSHWASTKCCLTWKSKVTPRGRLLFRLAVSMRPISEIEFGSSPKIWPTPTTQDAKNNGGPSQHNRNTKPLNAEVGGSLNPQWVEWLMGYPEGWTDLKD